jgi:hypothetical protein
MSQQRLPALTLTPWNIAFQQHTVQCTILLSCILFYNVSACFLLECCYLIYNAFIASWHDALLAAAH